MGSNTEIDFRKIVQSISDYFVVFDRDFKVVYWNRQAARFTGLPATKVKGKSLYELYPRLKGTSFEKFLKKSMAAESPQSTIESFNYKSKEYVISFSTYPLKNGLVLQAKDISRQIRLERDFQQAQQIYSILVENSRDGLHIIQDGVNKYVNSAFVKITGYSRNELIGQPMINIIAPEWRDEVKSRMARRLAGKRVPHLTQVEIITKHGQRVPVEVNASVIQYEGRPAVMAVIRDISRRREMEENLKRLNRLYVLLSEINQAIVRIKDRDKLFKAVCDIAVDKGGFYMAVILLLDGDTGMLRPLSYAGHEDGFYDVIKPNIYDSEYERFCFVRAVKTGNLVVINDLEAVLDNIKFKDEVVRRGYKSVAAVPLKIADKVIGSFCIYMDRPHFFTDEEQDLLLEMADDISFALNAMELEKEHEVMENALKQSEEKYRSIVENAIVGIYQISPEGRFISVNPALARMYGYASPDDMMKSVTDIGKQIWADQADERRTIKELRERGFVSYSEVQRKKKDGTLFWVSLSVREVRDKDGRLLYDEGMNVDITDKKLAELALQESEFQLSRLLDNASDIILVHEIDPEGKQKLLRFNKKACEVLGYTYEEMSGIEFKQLIPVDMEKRVMGIIEELKTQGHVFFESGLLTRDGRSIPVEVSSSAVKIGGKDVVLTVARDISERKRLFEMVEEEARRRRIFMEQSRDGIVVLDDEGKVFELNTKFAEMLGYTLEEARNLCIWDWEKYFPRERVLEMIRTVDERGHFFETRHTRKDGTTYEVEISTTAAYFGGKKLIFCACRDITERKKAEQELRESQQRFMQVFQGSPVVMSITSLEEGRLVDVNDAFLNLFGYKRDEVLGRKTVELGIWETSDRQAFMQILNDKGRVENFEVKFHRRDGTTGDGILSGEIITVHGVKYILVALLDITARKGLERALVESEKKLRGIFETTPAGLAIAANEILIEANPRFFEIFSYSKDELIGKDLRKLYLDDASYQFDIKRAIQQIESYGVLQMETKGRRKDGKLIDILVQARLLDEQDPSRGVVFAVLDITEVKNMEFERQRLEKLESVGLLAGGIAHDFNNILTAILGNISLARMETGGTDEIKAYLAEAEKASLRAKDLTQQLLTFARGGAPVKKLTSLRHLITDTAEFALRGSNVQCRYNFADDLWHAEVDVGQISQVISNLVINARQAMPMGGIIEITAENFELKDEQSLGKMIPLKTGNYVKITVEDHGIGIPPQYLDKIFDPYFTTKQSGSGLGLTTAYSIVRQHDGFISVESTVNVGTRFYVYLPASKEKVEKTEEGRDVLTMGSAAKVLIMDDEPVVRDVVARMLRQVGCGEIVQAVNGEEAIKLYQEALNSGRPFDIVILDLTIPGGLGGKETIMRLREIHPDVKAIVSSGYAEEAIMADYKQYGFKAVLSKPYDLKLLASVIKQVLSS